MHAPCEHSDRFHQPEAFESKRRFHVSRRAVLRFLQSEEGPTSVEYAVMLGLIIAVCIVTIKAFGDHTGGIWANSQSKLDEVGF
jgi:pilus assembly protein Flp/PilA